MTISDGYEFGEGFQLRLLAYLLKDPKKMFDVVEPQFFSSPVHREISRIMKETYAAHGKQIQISRETLKELVRVTMGEQVSFSTWLPGSQETLTSYLLADIASECKTHYVVPGMRQSTCRFATALGQRVPLLSDYLKLVPTTTQKDDIDNLKAALIRLPKRVVVLLDEIDRMEKDELLTLLKVIRGISTLPNLSFVCAGDRDVRRRAASSRKWP